MARYIVSQTREISIEAPNAAKAREQAEAIFFHRPGYSRELLRQVNYNPTKVEKVRE